MATPQQGASLKLELRRTFASPREKVFAAWTERQQLEQWMCKDVPTHSVRYRELDVRTGGRYSMEVSDQASGDFYVGQGAFREVKPPEKLVFTWGWTKRQPDGTQLPVDSETQVTVEFFPRGKSTEVVLTHEFFRTAQSRDEHARGWTGCFDALAKALDALSH